MAMLFLLQLLLALRASAEDPSNSVSPWSADSGPSLSQLRAEVAELRQQRAEDRAALRRLEASCSGGQGVTGFRSQLEDLKADLEGLLRAKERSADAREWRAELDSVHAEWQKTRLEVRALQERGQESSGQRGRSKATVEWLRRTVEELRKEMREVGRAQNVSLAMGQRGQLETAMALLRSDVVALRSRWEEVVVNRDRDLGQLGQLRVDVDAVQQHQREMAERGQRFREQLSELKDDLLSATRGATVDEEEAPPTATGATTKKTTKKRNGVDDDEVKGRMEMDHFAERPYGKDRKPPHRRVRHQGEKALRRAEQLSREVALLSRRQASLEGATASTDAAARRLAERVAEALNATRSHGARQGATERRLEAVASEARRTRAEAAALARLTDAAGGIDKLHASTVQLFEALESLEDEFGKRMDGLAKEVSAFDFRMADVSAAVDILKNDRADHAEALRLARADAGDLREAVERNAYRLAAMRAELLRDAAGKMPMPEEAPQQQSGNETGSEYPTDCGHVSGATGIYAVRPGDTGAPVSVLCEVPSGGSGGWTVVQQRTTGGVGFDRDWEAYKNGFGQMAADGEFWLGNEALHRLTAAGPAALRFDMWDHEGRYYYARYESFRVLDEAVGYRLELSAAGFSGNASDAMSYHAGMRFSAAGADNDASSVDCARQYEGGWWYNRCQHVNVNGKYEVGLTWYDAGNNAWIQLRRVRMMVGPAAGR